MWSFIRPSVSLKAGWRYKCSVVYDDKAADEVLLLSLLSAAIKMESGQGGLGCPSALLVEPPSCRKSTGQLGKVLWSDHSPLLLLDCWKKNAIFIKHSHRLHGAWGCRVGSRRGAAGASRRDHSFSLLSLTPLRLMVRCMYHCSELILV